MSMFLSAQLLQVSQIMAQEEKSREKGSISEDASDLFYSFGEQEESVSREGADDDLFYSFGEQEEEKSRKKGSISEDASDLFYSFGEQEENVSGENDDDDLFYSFKEQEEEKPREKGSALEEDVNDNEFGIKTNMPRSFFIEKVLATFVEAGNDELAEAVLKKYDLNDKTKNEVLKFAKENNHKDVVELINRYRFASEAKCIIC